MTVNKNPIIADPWARRHNDELFATLAAAIQWWRDSTVVLKLFIALMLCLFLFTFFVLNQVLLSFPRLKFGDLVKFSQIQIIIDDPHLISESYEKDSDYNILVNVCIENTGQNDLIFQTDRIILVLDRGQITTRRIGAFKNRYILNQDSQKAIVLRPGQSKSMTLMFSLPGLNEGVIHDFTDIRGNLRLSAEITSGGFFNRTLARYSY